MTFNLYKTLSSDESLEREGVWIYPYGPKEEGFPGFKVARAGGANTEYDKMLTKGLRPYQRLLSAAVKNPEGMDTKTVELVKRATQKAFVATCMLDWSDLKDKNEKAVAFSKEAADTLFNDLPAVYQDLMDAAQNIATFQREENKVEAGN